MTKALWFVGGIIGGALVAFILAIAVEFFSAIVHPFPEDFGGTPEEMREHVARYPDWVLAVVVLFWGATAFAATWTANRIGGRGAAIVVGVLLVAAVVFNVSMLPYPIWFEIASVSAIALAAAWASLGVRYTPATRLDAGTKPPPSTEQDPTDQPRV